jgi:uncharacterized protein
LKKTNFLKLIILAIFALILFFLLVKKTHENSENTLKEACFKNICVNLEIAKTQEEKEKGLMERKSLDQNAGMIFLYDEKGTHDFWMKNTLIPLDMIWINDNKIVHIEHAIPCEKDPCQSYESPFEADKILEVNGNFTSENNISIGDIIELK